MPLGVRSAMTMARGLLGAWQRQSIARDGQTDCEHTVAVWLQAPDAFAEVRVPHGADATVEAFSGITTCEEAGLRWHHTLDRNGEFAGDRGGVVQHRGNELIVHRESDVGDACLITEEVWVRIDPGRVGVVLTGERWG